MCYSMFLSTELFFSVLYQWHFIASFHVLVGDGYKREIYWQLAFG